MTSLSRTLSGLLEETTRHHPHQSTYFKQSDQTLSIHALHLAQARFAAHAIRHGIKQGDRVGILFDNSPEFLTAFFGLARARAAAVSLPLPASMMDLQGHYVERLTRILTTAEVTVIVASEMFAPLVQSTLSDVSSIRVLTVGAFSEPVDTSSLPVPEPDDLAFVQFTSGSSSAPKGACLTHDNIVTNLRAIQDAAQLSERDRLHMWLPFFHDMGIFGTLALMTCGATIEISSPSTFVKSPERWLARFCEQKATIYVGPNFSFEAMMRAVSDASTLDLSALRLAFNGAEPIDARMLERFEARFAAAGYRPEAMFPVYGLAEATLAVSFPPCQAAPTVLSVDGRRLANDGIVERVGQDHPAATAIVGVGQPVPQIEVRLMPRKNAPQSQDSLPSGHVGRVEIRGPSVMTGYLSEDVTTAPSLRDGWFDTGDLGFFYEGELFITGREKEMIIVRGENFYPQDVEALAKDIEGVYRRRAVAFAVTNPERIAVVAETILEGADAHQALARTISQTIARALGLAQVEVHVVEKGKMKRTTSGKWQRIRMRTMVEQNIFSEVLASHAGAAKVSAS